MLFVDLAARLPKHPLIGVFAYLYRRDREWLRSHCPARSRERKTHLRVDWCGRDVRLAGQVNQTKDALLRELGRPKRISPTALGRQLASLALIQKHLHKLPRTEALLNSAVETRRDFAIRRVSWAALQIRSEGREMKTSSLFRRAGLRPDLAGDPHVRASLQIQIRSEPSPHGLGSEELAAWPAGKHSLCVTIFKIMWQNYFDSQHKLR